MKLFTITPILLIGSIFQSISSQSISKCTQNGVFALTFDDGVTNYTGEMLDILKVKGIKATFFYIGSNLESEEHKIIAKRAFDEGHQIASHTWTHSSLTSLSPEQVKDEMKKTEDILEKTIGRKVRYMRSPYLESNDAVNALLKQMDYVQVGVNLDSNDWKYRDTAPQKIFDAFKDTMNTPGVESQSFISLQHDLTSPSVAKIGEIIDLVRSKNFRFVTVEECLGKGPAYKDSQSTPSTSSSTSTQSSTYTPSSTSTQSSTYTPSSTSTQSSTYTPSSTSTQSVPLNQSKPQGEKYEVITPKPHSSRKCKPTSIPKRN